MASQVALSNLDADHLIPLQGSLQQILSTKLAEFTFAHVVDGIPVDDDPPQLYFANPRPWHGAPSDAAVQEVLEWRSVFKVEDLAIARDVS